jgi:hypothetical protein
VTQVVERLSSNHEVWVQSLVLQKQTKKTPEKIVILKSHYNGILLKQEMRELSQENSLGSFIKVL